MFRSFHKSKTVLLDCPYCGNTQAEPALVISSYCRECGEHFRVQKGKAIASPGARVTGVAEIRKHEEKKSPPKEESQKVETSEDAWLVTAEEKDKGARPLSKPAPEDDSTDEGISAGAFFGLAEDEEETSSSSKKSIGDKAQSREILAEGSMGTLLQNQTETVPQLPEKEKMPANYKPPGKKKKTEHASELTVRCFRCYHIQKVSRFAKSTQCERCSVYISLANYEIKANKCHTLRTRGDIVISRRGGLINNSEIACHNLTVNGAIDARVDCSGTAVFRHSGIVHGQLFCQKLIVEKNCEVSFPDGVKTERAEIHGHLTGNMTCSKILRVSRAGIVEGNVVAAETDIKDGGRISGETEIKADVKTDLPLKMGFNPTIIG